MILALPSFVGWVTQGHSTGTEREMLRGDRYPVISSERDLENRPGQKETKIFMILWSALTKMSLLKNEREKMSVSITRGFKMFTPLT